MLQNLSCAEETSPSTKFKQLHNSYTVKWKKNCKKKPGIPILEEEAASPKFSQENLWDFWSGIFFHEAWKAAEQKQMQCQKVFFKISMQQN